MQFGVIARFLGMLLMFFSITMLVPLTVSVYYRDNAHLSFFIAFAITFACGFALWAPFHSVKRDLRGRDGFMVTSLFWIVLSLFGALPFGLADTPHLQIPDAVFESISGLTTTGSTVIVGLDDLPKSILYYRQQLQLLGGIGFIVIAVAIFPMLGIGGMQLYRAEIPGPVKDSKLTPRITETAKWLTFIYLGLTTTCALSYWAAGMTLFDAICHSFSTVATGGSSTHDASMGYFNTPAILLVSTLFMFISAINFALHYFAWHKAQLKQYLRDSECAFYFYTMLTAIIIVVSALYFYEVYELPEAILHGMFQVVSIATTTGYGTAQIALWPTFVPFLMLFAGLIGGCAGSTGGGLKVIRVMLIFKQGALELRRLVHPNATLSIKLKRQTVPDQVITAVWSFFAVYVLSFFIIILLLLATGLDFVTAFSATASCISNVGPGLGAVANHYGDINDYAKGILCFAMLLGRLEIFTLLVLCTPSFWRA